MCTTNDAAGTSVLMVSYVTDRAVRLLELPSFEGRGCLPNVSGFNGDKAGFRMLGMAAQLLCRKGRLRRFGNQVSWMHFRCGLTRPLS